MANDETFRYDPTPMNHAFPGQPDDCFDMVNQYGTYNIQKTADTDNAYPAIAQGMPKVGHFARRRLCVYSHVCHTSGQYPAVACLPLRTMGVFISSGWSKSLSSFARLSSV